MVKNVEDYGRPAAAINPESECSNSHSSISKYVVSGKVTINMTADNFKPALIEVVMISDIILTFFISPRLAKYSRQNG